MLVLAITHYIISDAAPARRLDGRAGATAFTTHSKKANELCRTYAGRAFFIGRHSPPGIAVAGHGGSNAKADEAGLP
ncbi:hypothetical protein [Paenibacillus mendelii]|uniref:Uncharacterized protein n=1 Tax=Paenibacillus mendelii TaxID=206163 RepID=A0ABV6J7T6_9BACL|nr:hypothetical protein [Paenibacillus mendelii]MCQ6562190.1 hypothetical protein [Paenibacillus mendelii]